MASKHTINETEGESIPQTVGKVGMESFTDVQRVFMTCTAWVVLDKRGNSSAGERDEGSDVTPVADER